MSAVLSNHHASHRAAHNIHHNLAGVQVPDAPPAGGYMGAQQMAWFEQRLRAMREQKLEQLVASQQNVGEVEFMADELDKATSVEAGSMATAQGDRLKADLRRIDESIQRIRSGDYGYCVDTGDEIGLPRLMANPTATRTVEAQRAFEFRQRQHT